MPVAHMSMNTDLSGGGVGWVATCSFSLSSPESTGRDSNVVLDATVARPLGVVALLIVAEMKNINRRNCHGIFV